jgi:hypothetical protein
MAGSLYRPQPTSHEPGKWVYPDRGAAKSLSF